MLALVILSGSEESASPEAARTKGDASLLSAWHPGNAHVSPILVTLH